jgi:glycerophosphoryl diester phosphodiesterase
VCGLLGHLLLPTAPGPLWILVLTVGAMLLIWFLVNLVVTLLSTITLAFVIIRLYWQLGYRGERVSAPNPPTPLEHHRFILSLSRRGMLAAGLVATFVAGTAGVVAVATVRLQDRTQIIAHRGASGAAPENTLAAVERAILDGSHRVEVDVQETADGRVAVVHDRDFQRVAGNGLRVAQATLEDLGRLDVGSWFAHEFRDQRVPTLERVLDMCRGKVGVTIELKYYGQSRRLEQRVVAIVEAHEMASQVEVMSLNYDGIQTMRSLRPQWRYGYLAAVTLSDPIRVEADFLAVSVKLATWRFVRAAHRRGKEVYVWTVNDPLTLSTLMGRGVDGIITDEPARARGVLAQRARMSSVERLLVQLAAFLGAGRDSHLDLDDI